MISEFLFYDEEGSKEEKVHFLSQKVEIRELIKTRFNREVLSEILMDLQKDVSGEARQTIYELYKGLGLHHDAYAKLKSWRWEVISQGILELTQMRVEDSYVFIRRFVNHRKGIIRKQAQIATVSLQHEGIGYLLDTCSYQISEWQQMKLLDVLRHLEDFTPPRFKIWLTSKNKDVVLFSLRLIRFYNQNDANQAIIQLLKHRNSQIKAEAIQCLKEFGVTESISMLKTVFRKSGTAEKIAILDALASLGEADDIDFLKKIEKNENNFTVRSKALAAINTINPGSVLPSEGIYEPSLHDLQFAQPESIEASEHEEDERLQLQFNFSEEKSSADEFPELYEEDPGIFDQCAWEELEDILDEVHRETEPEYLPLNFLPLVKDQEEIYETNPSMTSGLMDEEKFKEDLDTILNNIAMKNDQKNPKIEEAIPDFLPRVVGNDENDQPEASDDQARDIEVLAEQVEANARAEADFRELSNPDLKNTPVVAETVSDKINEKVEAPDTAETNQDHAEEPHCEELYGFSIFHEMFRDFDNESKLILLDEILVVGEEKELCFLGTLANDPDRRIRNKARHIRKLLAEKLKNAKKEAQLSSVESHQDAQDLLEEEDLRQLEQGTEESHTEEEEKLPMEFCFYEGAIDEILEANDISTYADRDIEIGEAEAPGESDLPLSSRSKWRTLLDNISLPSLRDKKNG